VQGDAEIVEVLNEVLTAELTAINQYFIDSRMCANWGYERLAEHFREESIDEMKDAEALIDRVLYLEGVPNLQRLGSVLVGETVAEQLQLALDVEQAAVERLNRGVALCAAKGDNGTRDLLAGILHGEEESIDWLETQLSAIADLGVQLYLSEQLHA